MALIGSQSRTEAFQQVFDDILPHLGAQTTQFLSFLGEVLAITNSGGTGDLNRVIFDLSKLLHKLPASFYQLNSLLHPYARIELDARRSPITNYVLKTPNTSRIVLLGSLQENAPQFHNFTASRLQKILSNPVPGDPVYENLYNVTDPALQDSLAQLAQDILDSNTSKICRKNALRFLRRSGGVPPSLLLYELVQLGPFQSTGFSDLYYGELHASSGKLHTVTVAIKKPRAFHGEVEILREAILSRQLRHPNVSPFLGVSYDDQDHRYGLVTPFMTHGNIIEFLKRYPNTNRLTPVFQIMKGLEFLHNWDTPVAHRDIKGANVLVKDDLVCCLSDFGLSSTPELSQRSREYAVGTAAWMAPEILVPPERGRLDLLKVDIFALGITILEIFVGKPPLYHQSFYEIYTARVIRREKPRLPPACSHPFSPFLSELVGMMLEYNPTDRPSIRMICQSTKHALSPPPQIVLTEAIHPRYTGKSRALDTDSMSVRVRTQQPVEREWERIGKPIIDDGKPFCSLECQYADTLNDNGTETADGCAPEVDKKEGALTGIRSWILRSSPPKNLGARVSSMKPKLEPPRLSLKAASSIFKPPVPNHPSSVAATTGNSHFVNRHPAPSLVKPPLLVPPSVSVPQLGPLANPLLRPDIGSQKLLVAIYRSTRHFGAWSRTPLGLSASLPTSLASNILIGARGNCILPSEGNFEPTCSHVRTSTESGGPQNRHGSERLSPRDGGEAQSLSLLQLAYRSISSTFTESSSATLVDSDLYTASASPTENKQKYIGKRRPRVLSREPIPPISPTPEDGSSMLKSGSGFFNQSHHFALSHSTMCQIGTQHQHYYGHTSALERLAKYVIPGAEVDSREREYPPQCYPGTREDILTSIRKSFCTPSEQTRVIWITGPAGAGKSAIMQTLGETMPPDRLFAALFLSRSEPPIEATRVLPSIAYQLAVRSGLYASYLEEQFKTDPLFLERSLAAQFHSLITVPFAQRGISPGSECCPILLDAPEECRNERDQCKIIELVYDFIQKHPTIPITWIFATRLKQHLKVIFPRMKTKSASYQECHLSISSEQACRDVERYLVDEFKRIRECFPETIPSRLLWPTQEQIRRTTFASSGYFAFASGIIHFIDKSNGDPVTRLRCVLTFLDGTEMGTTPALIERPFGTLDLVYSQIMSGIPTAFLPDVKLLLGYFLSLVVPTSGKRSLLLAYAILGLGGRLEYALQALSPVLALPSPANRHIERLRFLHASFVSYLQDPNRSGEYWVDSNFTLTTLWRCYTRILLQWLECRSTKGIRLFWAAGSDAVDLGEGHDPRKEMFRQASSLWTVFLHSSCVRWCPPSCPMKDQILASPSVLEIIDTLRQMDFGSPKIFGGDPVKMLKSLTWIQKHTPVEFRHKFILLECQLAELDKPRFFKALCEKKWYRGITERSQSLDSSTSGKGINCIRNLDASEWPTAASMLATVSGSVGDLVRLLQAGNSAETTVTIFGTDPANCCGLIRHQKSPKTIQYHIFPYSETGSI